MDTCRATAMVRFWQYGLSGATLLALVACGPSASGDGAQAGTGGEPTALVADVVAKIGEPAADATCRAATGPATQLFREVLPGASELRDLPYHAEFSPERDTVGPQITCAWAIGLPRAGLPKLVVTWSTFTNDDGPQCSPGADGCRIRHVDGHDVVVGGLHDDKYTAQETTDPRGRFVRLQFITTDTSGQTSAADRVVDDPRDALARFLVQAARLTIPASPPASAAPPSAEAAPPPGSTSRQGDTGMAVDRVENACAAITGPEVSAAINVDNVALLRDELYDDVLRDAQTNVPLTPDPGFGRLCTYADAPEPTDESTTVLLFVQLDPDRKFYLWEKEMADGPPDPVNGLGDEAFAGPLHPELPAIRYIARWGVWTTKISVFHPSREPVDVNPADVADLLQRFVTRLPRDHQP